MDDNSSDALLVEAAMLITATRLRIARSLPLLGGVDVDHTSRSGSPLLSTIVARRSTHPPSAPPP